jgi:hypothetical protein
LPWFEGTFGLAGARAEAAWPNQDGAWCTSAQLRPGVGAVGNGPTAEAAVADPREALEALLAEVRPPDELTLTLNVA